MDKITRMLFLYSKLIKGEKVNKTIFCFENDCSFRTFDRDIEDVRMYLSESFSGQELKYDRKNDTYFIEGVMGHQELEEMEFLFIERILRDSSVLRKDELEMLMLHLLVNTRNYRNLINDKEVENDNYESPVHNSALLKMHGDLAAIISQKKCIKMNCYEQNRKIHEERILPCAVKYDLGYLYLIGFRIEENSEYPIYFRLDRIDSFVVERIQTKAEQDRVNHYLKNYANGITQMHGGEYVKIKMKCKKEYFPYVHDKFRQTQVVEDADEFLIVTIDAFENGFVKWIISQPQQMYTILEPESVKIKLVAEAKKIVKKYGGIY